MDMLDGPGVSHVRLWLCFGLFFLCFIQNTVKCSGQIITITDQENVFSVLNKRTALNFTHLQSVISYLLTR